MFKTWHISYLCQPMGQKKLLRFSQIKSFDNVFEYPENMPGTWTKVFDNNHPITLELACGRGEYTVGLAQLFPDENYIGVDVKGNRLYLGAKKALDTPLNNVRFLRTQIEMLPDYFSQNEIHEIWITFPDPQLRTSRAKKRLTHPRFLRLYQKIIKNKGNIHLKTDSPVLYHFTLQVIKMHQLNLLEACDDVYGQKVIDNRLKRTTHYESLDIAKSHKIFYVRFIITIFFLEKID